MQRWVLIRGLMRDKRHWRCFAEDLTAQMTAVSIDVIALDTLGNGTLSQYTSPLNITAYARALVQKLEGHDNCIIGLSMGGMIALEMARLAPQKVSKVVVINASAVNLSPWYARLNLKAIVTAYLGRVKQGEVHWLECTALKLSSERYGDDQAMCEHWSELRLGNRSKMQNVVRQIWACANFQAPDKLQQPVFVFNGSLDRLVNPRCSVELALYYQTELIEFEQAGHDISLDSPAALIAQLKKVLLSLA
ncbi:MAG: pimeloyl-ACP methyl ester carboxylesterase [Shewanella sp.]|jgi:pimeloyl-ACP methyl ester carboxylesterase